MGICSSKKRPVEAIQESPFRIFCSEEDIINLSKYMVEVAVKENAEVQGLADRAFYLVMDGSVELTWKNKAIATKFPGDTLGLPLDFKNSDRLKEVTAVAKSPTRLLRLAHRNIQLMQKERPELYVKIKSMLGQTARSLALVECFEGISTEYLCVLNHMLKTSALAKGDVLFEEGSRGGSLYVVVQGAVQAYAKVSEAKLQEEEDEKKKTPIKSKRDSALRKKNPPADQKNDPPVKMLFEFKPGMLFGEISLVMDIPRTAAIKASQDSVLMELTRDRYALFKSIMSTSPEGGNFQLEKVIKVRVAEHFRKYKVPFFEAIPDNKYSTLASFCEIIQLPPNKIVFKEGDPGKGFYMLAHGQVKVTVVKVEKDGKKHELELTHMGPGKYFGEIALVQESPRTATITTTKPSVLLVITKANFELFCKEAPEAVADFEIKLARYNVQLRSVLYHPIGMKYFSEHVKAEFSEENIDFWRECRDFRHLTYADIVSEPVQYKKMRKGSLALPAQFLDQDEGDEAGVPDSPEHGQPVAPGGTPASKARSGLSMQPLLRAGYDLVVHGEVDALGERELRTLMRTVGLGEDLVGSLEAEDMGHLLDSLGAKAGKVAADSFVQRLSQIAERGVNPAKRERGGEGFTSSLLWKLQFALRELNIPQVREVFNKMDTEGTGRVSFQDFYAVIKELEAGDAPWASKNTTSKPKPPSGMVLTSADGAMSKAQLQEKFKALDQHHTGEIDFNALVKFMLEEGRQKDQFQAMLRRRAVWLYYEFVSDSAPRQVNVQGPSRKAVAKRLESEDELDTHVFDKTEAEVLALLSSDTFFRFKSSELFQNFLKAVDSYTHVKSEEKGGQKESKKKKPKVHRESLEVDENATISIDDLMKSMGNKMPEPEKTANGNGVETLRMPSIDPTAKLQVDTLTSQRVQSPPESPSGRGYHNSNESLSLLESTSDNPIASDNSPHP
eukprot:g60359.t1